MNWTDVGFILSCRKHGESSVILHAFTEEHGRAAGLVRGGAGRRLRGVLQTGNEVELTWRSRLAEQLGTFVVEPRKSYMAALFDAPMALLASSAALSLLDVALPEREPHPKLYEATRLLFTSLDQGLDHWPSLLVRWELGLLAEVGYGLDLSNCAATGATEDLIYVSPKSARSVSRGAGEPYHDKLLRLPPFLSVDSGGSTATSSQEILDGLSLTGYFLQKLVGEHRPDAHLSARERFINGLRQRYLSQSTAEAS